jgi:hypothetical protein
MSKIFFHHTSFHHLQLKAVQYLASLEKGGAAAKNPSELKSSTKISK